MVRQKAIIKREQPLSRLVTEWLTNFDNDDESKNNGGFFDDGFTIWVVHQSKLLIIDSRTGTKIGQYQFGTNFIIDCAISCNIAGTHQGLLLGVRNNLKYMVCCFDVAANRLISASLIPHRVVSLCVIDSDEKSKMKDNIEFKDWSSMVIVGTVEGHVYLYDANFQSRTPINNEYNPVVKAVYGINDNFGQSNGLVDISDFCRTSKFLQWPDEPETKIAAASTAVTSLFHLKGTSLLAIGFNFGGIVLYSLDLLEAMFVSQFERGAAAVMKFTLVEPEDDPRPTLYLWALRDKKTCEIEGVSSGSDAPSLEMFQLGFTKRISTPGLDNIYSEFTHCISRFYWFPDSCHTLLDCSTLSTWSDQEKSTGDDSHLVNSRIFMYFFWINKNGQLIGCLFDLHSWYHAQMPAGIIPLSEYRICPFVAWHFYGIGNRDWNRLPLVCVPIQCSLVRHQQSPDTEFNNFACSYSLNVDVMTQNKMRRFEIPDIQSQVLDQVVSRGFDGLKEPKELFSLLQTAKLTLLLDDGLTKEQMRRHIWTAMLENGRVYYLTNCFSAGVASGIAILDEFVEWAWSQALVSKGRLDDICGSLFDGSTVGISKAMKRTLRKEASNLNLLFDAHSFCLNRFKNDSSTVKTKLNVRVSALREICLYSSVVLWFIDAGVLPEKPGFYCRRAISEKYKRLSDTAVRDGHTLFIDILLLELNENLEKEPVEGLNAPLSYPLLTFRDVLSVYLISGVNAIKKHAFVFYTLLDIENSSVDETVKGIGLKFATAILSDSDPCLANYGSLAWHLDNENDEIASRYLMDVLVSWPQNTLLRNAFATVVERLRLLQSKSRSFGGLILPSLSFSPNAIQFHYRSKEKDTRSNALSGRFGRSDITLNRFGDISELRGTPTKRTADQSFNETHDTITLGSAKRARLDYLNAPKITFPSQRSSQRVSKNIDRSEESDDEETCNFEDARSLLKVPPTVRVATLDTSGYTTAPVSILKKPNMDIDGSSYMEKSIRFNLPPGLLNLSEGSSFLIDNAETDDASFGRSGVTTPEKDESVLSPETYQSPTDEEIVFSFAHNRWSMADVPSPPEENGDEEEEEEEASISGSSKDSTD